MDENYSIILADVATIINKLFNYPTADVDFESVAEDVNGWDSLSHTRFIMEIERKFSIEFDPYTVSKFRCIGDLVEEIGKLQK